MWWSLRHDSESTQIGGTARKRALICPGGKPTCPLPAWALSASLLPLSGPQYTVVYKFGGSSVRDAERMREVANIVCSFPEHLPCVVLSAMGKTTNNLLAAGEEAMTCKSTEVEQLPHLLMVRELHERTCAELGLPPADTAEVAALLQQLTQLLTGISLMQEVTSRTSANLVSFGERLATRIFASYLRTQGVAARQWDSFGRLGFVSSDDFSNGDILPETYAVAGAVLADPIGSPSRPEVAVVTGFLAKGQKSGAITTLGRGGSDLTATVLGRALGVSEVQVWKDVDGVLTADPRIAADAVPVPFLTYEEATELAYFGAQVLHPLAMQPAISSERDLNVRVKNSYNMAAPGTLITRHRDMSSSLLTSVVRKQNVSMLDIVSTRMLGQHGFLAQVFAVMAAHQVSVDVVATSEVSVSVTLDPAKLWSKPGVESGLARLQEELGRIATVSIAPEHAVLSLICNVRRSNEILERVFRALGAAGISVKMISQGASRCNISILVDGACCQCRPGGGPNRLELTASPPSFLGAVADLAVRQLHDEFFPSGTKSAQQAAQPAAAAR